MRSALTLSLLLLVCAFLVYLKSRPNYQAGDNTSELNLLLFGRGQMVQRVDDPLTQRYGLDHGIVLTEDVLRFPKDLTGLRVALFDREFRLIQHKNFQLSKQAGDWKRLNRLLRTQPDYSIIALHNNGELSAPESVVRRVLEENKRRFARLGTSLWPEQVGSGSWCLIAMKGRNGYRLLAEAHSNTQNVTLAFSVGPTHWYNPPAVADRIRVEENGPHTIKLTDEYMRAHLRQGAIFVQPNATLGEMKLRSLRTMPTAKDEQGNNLPARIVWRNVALGQQAIFSSRLAIDPSVRDKSDGVIFELLINGQVLKSIPWVFQEGTDPTWAALSLDLSQYANQHVELEMKVSPGQSGYADYAIWGDPQLTWTK